MEKNLKILKKKNINFQGNLIYRLIEKKNFFNSQIELIGICNYLNNKLKKIQINFDNNFFSYLLFKNNNLIYEIPSNKIEYSKKNNKNKKLDNIFIKISNNNFPEILLINDNDILNYILIFLTGNYSGYYKINEKIIEDNFYLCYYIEKYNNENNIKLLGKGKDLNGEYNLNGSIYLYQNKNVLINNNMKYNYKNLNSSLNDNCIILGEFNIKKCYI